MSWRSVPGVSARASQETRTCLLALGPLPEVPAHAGLAGVVDNAGDAVAVSHDARGDEQRGSVEVIPQELVDLNLDRVLLGLAQGDLELGREAVDLRVGVTVVVTATTGTEDLRNTA